MEVPTPGRVKKRKSASLDEPDDFAQKSLKRELYNMIGDGKLRIKYYLFIICKQTKKMIFIVIFNGEICII